ncbi:MAG: M28 family peptidase [Cyclobacteriaceae bacterium]|nr:M28 family peptidase [Cyclobacteriaceae bacterium]UYN88206.1 MAG: M28 family peptidase [Cyclobacteriaceae bacterium]
MNKIFVGLSLFVTLTALAQKKVVSEVNKLIKPTELEAHLGFLAADEMRGRDTGSPELKIAGNYIATWFHQHGLKTLPDAPAFFQPVNLERSTPANAGSVTLGSDSFLFKESMIILSGANTTWNGEFVYVGYGAPEDLEKVDIKGKMVLALAGSKEADNINKVFSVSSAKYASVIERGGEGLVELLTFSQIPFPTLVNFFTGGPRWGLQVKGSTQPHVWLKPADVKNIAYKDSERIVGNLSIAGQKREVIPGRNVAGLISGTDPKLKDEYIIVTAHYDHIGVGKPTGNQDSIFNGARDNAIGTVALLQVAKYLGQHPPKRSILLVAVTSEEKGLLGSRWYVDHPLVPLEKHVLNINCDGVGYNDKSIITSISLGRTSADAKILTAAKAFGLGVGGDPDPKEGFYERSDQVSFATKGIPAIKLQPGLAKMDDEIRKYYHRQADEVSTLDFDYLTKFYKTFVYAVSLLGNEQTPPFWNTGDKYEEAGKKLYNRN